MSTETMRKTMTVLSVAWVLWQHYSPLDNQGRVTSTAWLPEQGFETRKACVSRSEKNALKKERTLYGMPMNRGKGDVNTWHCFPSDLDPRPRK